MGRTKEAHDFWLSANSFADKSARGTLRTPLCYIHASPGVGKSFFFTEIMKKMPNDIPACCRKFAENVYFIALDFNGIVSTVGLDKVLVDSRVDQAVILRLAFFLCCQEHVTYRNFIRNLEPAVEKGFAFINIWNCVARRLECLSKKYHLILLVDEVGKTIAYRNGAPDDTRSYLCTLQDEWKMQVVFSTLDKQIMINEMTNSSRRLQVVTSLPLLESADLAKELRKLCENRNFTHAKQSVSSEQEKEHVIKSLVDITGGHARSFEYIVDSIVGHQGYKLINLNKVIADAITLGYSLKTFPYELIRLVLLGHSVPLDMKVENQTIESFINQGVLIGSFGDDTPQQIIPFMPELFLHFWVNSALKKGIQECKSPIFEHLYNLLNVRLAWSNDRWETFHMNWELMIRHCRPPNYKSITIREIYSQCLGRDSITNNLHQTNNLLDVKVDGLTELKNIFFDKRFKFGDFSKFKNVIFTPLDNSNPGFDELIIYPEAEINSSLNINISKPLPLFIQNKYAADTATTNYSNSHAKKCCRLISSFIQNNCEGADKDRFVVLFIVKGNVRNIARKKPLPNVLFLDKNEISVLYGRTLASFANSLEYSQIGILPPEKA